MSIENNLKRIADALELIAGKMSHIDAAVTEEVAPTVATPEDVNAALLKKYGEMTTAGVVDAQAKILAVMQAAPFNAVSVNDLSVEQYDPLIVAVEAL